MKGRVLQTTGSWYHVLLNNGLKAECRLPGKFKQEDLKTTNPIAVGDRVEVESDDATGDKIIQEIYPRDNYIVRQSPRQKHYKHIIAANIDQALLIATIAQPRTSTGFIDRFLVAAETYHIPVTILINKMDLMREKDFKILEEWASIYAVAGYQVMNVSAEKKEGTDAVKQFLKDKTTLVAGHSGVGKSTLINQLNPGMQLKTQRLSTKWQKGMHTTTYATMYPMEENTFIIDTPGIKEFFVVEIEPEELSGYFPEMRALAGKCQYNNCLHESEPGCIVKKAVEEGNIAYSRFENYLNILENMRSVNYWERM